MWTDHSGKSAVNATTGNRRRLYDFVCAPLKEAIQGKQLIDLAIKSGLVQRKELAT
jgi:hypothetical protein